MCILSDGKGNQAHLENLGARNKPLWFFSKLPQVSKSWWFYWNMYTKWWSYEGIQIVILRKRGPAWSISGASELTLVWYPRSVPVARHNLKWSFPPNTGSFQLCLNMCLPWHSLLFASRLRGKIYWVQSTVFLSTEKCNFSIQTVSLSFPRSKIFALQMFEKCWHLLFTVLNRTYADLQGDCGFVFVVWEAEWRQEFHWDSLSQKCAQQSQTPSLLATLIRF